MVAPGGVLPITLTGRRTRRPASQLMYDLSRNLLVQGTGTAGLVSLLGSLAWPPALVFAKAAISDSAAKGALTQMLERCPSPRMGHRPGGVREVARVVCQRWAADGHHCPSWSTVWSLDQSPVYVQSTASAAPGNGGSFRAYTAAGNGTTPTSGTHSVTFWFQSASTTATTTLAASPTALACLRVAPAVA